MSESITIHAEGHEPVTTDLEGIRRATRVLEGGAARRKAAGQRQTDLEEFTGNEAEDRREAEVGGIAADRLRSIIERIERLAEEIKALQGDVKDIYTEAKSAGFDPAVIRIIVRERKKDPADVEEEHSLLDLYRHALGM